MGLFSRLFFGKKKAKRQVKENQIEEKYERRERIQPISPSINEDFDLGIYIIEFH
ncbi:hypothetical protein [Virgibacillus pantothenticus]|uniref:hypothetical protein n=1 Tax=Virgibacillus pantothenticus TaxID=1473 RepID=UPI00147AAA31|nr:hypothetical protein [Virgibacillus pantothenticus]